MKNSRSIPYSHSETQLYPSQVIFVKVIITEKCIPRVYK